MSPDRPSVSVVVPFRGSREEGRLLLRALARLRILPGDELIVADNTDDSVVVAAAGAHRPETVIRATGERSSYHARNAGAVRARGEWLLFIDADCAPAPGLIDAYFREPIDERCGALAGEVGGDVAQRGILARYARSRSLLGQQDGMHDPTEGSAATANLLVRRQAFESLGGFAEGIRSGGDFDLCRRLLDAGWTIESRPAAFVSHRHRERLPDFLGATARYAAGARWLNERYPGSARRWPLVPGLAGCAVDVPRLLIRRRGEEAAFRLVDGVGLIAHNVGYFVSNRAPRD